MATKKSEPMKRRRPVPAKKVVLREPLSKHRMFGVELHLKRTRNGIQKGGIEAVNRFAKANILEVVKIDEATGIAYLRSSVPTLCWAFSPQDSQRNTVGTKLHLYGVRIDSAQYRTFDGKPALPDYLAKYVKYIGGLDTRPGARLVIPKSYTIAAKPARAPRPAAAEPKQLG